MTTEYNPSFECKYCGESKRATVYVDGTGIFVPCDCQEARRARELEHRAEMERRKRLRRR